MIMRINTSPSACIPNANGRVGCPPTIDPNLGDRNYIKTTTIAAVIQA